MRKLQTLDEAGFEMNVFRSKNDGEIQFRTAQTDVTKIAAQYRTIMYDQKLKQIIRDIKRMVMHWILLQVLVLKWLIQNFMNNSEYKVVGYG